MVDGGDRTANRVLLLPMSSSTSLPPSPYTAAGFLPPQSVWANVAPTWLDNYYRNTQLQVLSCPKGPVHAMLRVLCCRLACACLCWLCVRCVLAGRCVGRELVRHGRRRGPRWSVHVRDTSQQPAPAPHHTAPQSYGFSCSPSCATWVIALRARFFLRRARTSLVANPCHFSMCVLVCPFVFVHECLCNGCMCLHFACVCCGAAGLCPSP